MAKNAVQDFSNNGITREDLSNLPMYKRADVYTTLAAQLFAWKAFSVDEVRPFATDDVAEFKAIASYVCNDLTHEVENLPKFVFYGRNELAISSHSTEKSKEIVKGKNFIEEFRKNVYYKEFNPYTSIPLTVLSAKDYLLRDCSRDNLGEYLTPEIAAKLKEGVKNFRYLWNKGDDNKLNMDDLRKEATMLNIDMNEVEDKLEDSVKGLIEVNYRDRYGLETVARLIRQGSNLHKLGHYLFEDGTEQMSGKNEQPYFLRNMKLNAQNLVRMHAQLLNHKSYHFSAIGIMSVADQFNLEKEFLNEIFAEFPSLNQSRIKEKKEEAFDRVASNFYANSRL